MLAHLVDQVEVVPHPVPLVPEHPPHRLPERACAPGVLLRPALVAQQGVELAQGAVVHVDQGVQVHGDDVVGADARQAALVLALGKFGKNNVDRKRLK